MEKMANQESQEMTFKVKVVYQAKTGDRDCLGTQELLVCQEFLENISVITGLVPQIL
jgi:hypothetical protein